MSKLLFLPVLAFLISLVLAPATSAYPPSGDSVPENAAIADSSTGMPDPMKGVQTDEESLAQDLSLVAQSRGWTVEQAAADYRAAEVVGRVAAEIAEKRPDIFVGSVLSSEPGGAPELYIKGLADDLIVDLVDKAEIEIKIVDNQPFSFDELEERKIKVHHALEEQGFRNVSTGFSLTEGGRISAGVTRQQGLPAEPAEILSRLPASLRDGVSLTVNDTAIAVDESAFGGMQLRDDGVNECTSGWSVWNSSGTTGVTGAGHCDGINQIVDPSSGTTTLTFQAEHRGQWGDVEWSTSPQLEPARFWRSQMGQQYVLLLIAVMRLEQMLSPLRY